MVVIRLVKLKLDILVQVKSLFVFHNATTVSFKLLKHVTTAIFFPMMVAHQLVRQNLIGLVVDQVRVIVHQSVEMEGSEGTNNVMIKTHQMMTDVHQLVSLNLIFNVQENDRCVKQFVETARSKELKHAMMAIKSIMMDARVHANKKLIGHVLELRVFAYQFVEMDYDWEQNIVTMEMFCLTMAVILNA